MTRQAQVPGYPGARLVMDPMSLETHEIDTWLEPAVAHARKRTGPVNLLALSGGGSYGAYGAGVLNGWTRTGERPEFDVIAGISTGSLIAPLAFLGPAYDEKLKQSYTTVSDKDIFERRSVFGILLNQESLADSAPLYQSLLKTFDEAALAAVAAEHRKGRRLYIGTSDLDAEVLMCWDLGAIAASGQPGSRELFCRVLLASASIPVAFPPVFFDVEVEGKRFTEMHGDGGCMAQVFGFVFLNRLMELSGKSEGRMFVLRNETLTTQWKDVHPTIISLAGRALDMTIRTQGLGDLYRAYLVASSAGIDFKVAYVPGSFHFEPRKGEFDPAWMTALFDTGYDQAVAGAAWLKEPPAIQLLQ